MSFEKENEMMSEYNCLKTEREKSSFIAAAKKQVIDNVGLNSTTDFSDAQFIVELYNINPKALLPHAENDEENLKNLIDLAKKQLPNAPENNKSESTTDSQRKQLGETFKNMSSDGLLGSLFNPADSNDNNNNAPQAEGAGSNTIESSKRVDDKHPLLDKKEDAKKGFVFFSPANNNSLNADNNSSDNSNVLTEIGGHFINNNNSGNNSDEDEKEEFIDIKPESRIWRFFSERNTGQKFGMGFFGVGLVYGAFGGAAHITGTTIAAGVAKAFPTFLATFTTLHAIPPAAMALYIIGIALLLAGVATYAASAVYKSYHKNDIKI